MGDAVPLQLDSKGRFERRVAWMTLALGAVTAAGAAVGHSPLAGVGVALGTLLAWLNLHWLDQTGTALSRLAQAQGQARAEAQAAENGPARPRIPQSTWLKFFARYALIGLALYVTVTRSPVPLVSVVGGLLMLGAAAMVVGLYDVFAEWR